jgi:hypothetical protein
MLDRAVSGAQKVCRYASWRLLDRVRPSPPPEIVHRRSPPGGSRQDEVVWRTAASAALEPIWGYVVSEPWGLSSDCLEALRGDMPPWRYATPSAIAWRRAARGTGGKVVEFDEVISLRHFYEWNYYHFTFDVLAKVALLDHLDRLGDMPLVVGPYAGELDFARELLSAGGFAERNWFIQDRDTYVRAGRITYCRPQLSHLDRARFVLDNIEDLAAVEQTAERLVFLVRRPPTKRHIVNTAHVESAMQDLGFEIVDSSALSMVDQIRLFRSTRMLVAIHGAGLTNMIYRAGRPMTVIELCSDRYSSDDFQATAHGLGFEFLRLEFPGAPTPDPQAADLVVDVDVLVDAVRTSMRRSLT